MTKHGVIDLISIDPINNRVLLSLIETRPWGEHGANISDMNEKINTYLNYVFGGELYSNYPDLKEKRVVFRLHSAYPVTKKEESYILSLRTKFLNEHNIEWETTIL